MASVTRGQDCPLLDTASPSLLQWLHHRTSVGPTTQTGMKFYRCILQHTNYPYDKEIMMTYLQLLIQKKVWSQTGVNQVPKQLQKYIGVEREISVCLSPFFSKLNIRSDQEQVIKIEVGEISTERMCTALSSRVLLIDFGALSMEDIFSSARED